MRKTIFVALLAAAALAACRKKKESATCPVDTYQYTFKNNAQVDTLNPYGSSGYQLVTVVKTGGKRVVKYLEYHEQCPPVQDGFGGIQLVFEADPGVSYFKYTSDKLAGAKCYCTFLSFASGSAFVPAGGTIEGTKINDSKWRINLDLQTRGTGTLKATTDFVVEQ